MKPYFLPMGIKNLPDHFDCFLGFIVWHLGKESKAGKFGTFILFLVLGLGVLGLSLKTY